MPLQVAVTIPPHPKSGRIHIGNDTSPVEEMAELPKHRLDIDTFTPEIASQVEDILLKEGYVVISGWDYLIEISVANIEPLRGKNG